MSRIRFVRLFSVLALAFWASALSASTITYAVGKCRLGLPSFPTISRALAAVPSATVIEVCPGTYREQLQITHSVTLEGVSNGSSARAIITAPAGGLVTNAMDDLGDALAVQLWVNHASGPVNMSNLTVDGSGNRILYGTFVVGIFYQNSSGAVNRVATRNQSGNLQGVGIWAEGGSSNPLVTVENNSVHDYDGSGISVDTNSATSANEITAVIKGNEVINSTPNGELGIGIGFGSVATVTNNLVLNSGGTGIGAFGSVLGFLSPTGSISSNTVVNASGTGIDAESELVPVTSNKILGSFRGITLRVSTVGINSKEAIQSNTITDSTIGIDFVCNADPNVRSNIIMDVGTALNHVPSAVATRNTYFNVGTIRTGGC